MRFFILIFIFIINLHGKYIIEYNNIDLGEIVSFDTIKDGYLEATITNGLAKLIIGKENAIIFEESYKKHIPDSYLQKKDKNNLLSVLNEILFKIKSKNSKISYLKKENQIDWIYKSKKTQSGYIKLDKNNDLLEFKHFEKNIIIKKI